MRVVVVRALGQVHSGPLRSCEQGSSEILGVGCCVRSSTHRAPSQQVGCHGLPNLAAIAGHRRPSCTRASLAGGSPVDGGCSLFQAVRAFVRMCEKHEPRVGVPGELCRKHKQGVEGRPEIEAM